MEIDDGRGKSSVPGRQRDEGAGGKQAARFQVQILAFDVLEERCHTTVLWRNTYCKSKGAKATK